MFPMRTSTQVSSDYFKIMYNSFIVLAFWFIGGGGPHPSYCPLFSVPMFEI